ncbi:MAG: 5' nucleotidase, NT5C type [Nanobdellota archaeon]
MNIAVDVDEVLANFLEQFLSFQEEHYGRRLAPKDCSSYYFRELFNISEEDEIKQIYEFYETQYFQDIKPLPDSQESLKKLKEQGHKLFIITARQNRVAKETRQWLDRYFPDMFEDVFITNEAGFKEEHHEKKVDVCKRINANVIVEDSLPNAIDVLKADMKAVLMDKPWNQTDSDPEGLHRVSSWSEALSILLQY